MNPVSPLSPLDAIPPDLTSLADYERRAQAHLAPEVWRHIQAGSGAEISLLANRLQFDRYSLVPRRLVDMANATTALELFGQPHAAPILLAPLAYQRITHPLGEIATMQAAVALDTTMVVSTLSSIPLEDIADCARAAAREFGRAATPPLWFQLYFQSDRAFTAELVRRAEEAGYRVLVFTVDAAVKLSGFALPEGVEAANLRDFPTVRQEARASDSAILFGTALLSAAPTWDDLAWLRSITNLPIVVKGLLSPEDARLAREHGADGIIVSNHGGRVLDGLVSPLEALPRISEALDESIPLLLDSGIRRGSDIAKALALGARAVLVGRPQMHALAVGGFQGVAHILHILRAELELTMAQLGCPNLASNNRQILSPTSPTTG